MPIPTYDRPPRRGDRPHLPLVRLPARAQWRVAITCWELLQIDTHFIGRRTLPHFDDACPGCAAKRPLRYEAYVSAVRSADAKHLIIALTLQCVNSFIDQVPNSKQLRGHILDIERVGPRTNGMLKAQLDEKMINTTRLPEAPNLWEHMAAIWNLDSNHIGSDNPDYREALSAELQKRRDENGPRDQQPG